MGNVKFRLSYDESLHMVIVGKLILETLGDVEDTLMAFHDYLDRCPPYPYVLVDWTEGKIVASVIPDYRQALFSLKPRLKEIFRYGEPDIYTKINVLAQTTINQFQTNYYGSREEALEALRQHAEAEKTGNGNG